MTTPHPLIDPRNFQDIVDEAKRRIPQYTPEWTDHNVSDPGVTLIELFAWMTDLIRYRLNTIPERQYRQFLKLMGAEPRPAVPAQAELLFWLSAAQAEAKLIPQGTEVATRQTGSRLPVTFATDADLWMRVPHLQYCVTAWRQRPPAPEFEYRDVTAALDRTNAQIAVFQPRPQPDDAFYLGFDENLGGQVMRLNLRCQTAAGFNIIQDDPPLAWEYWDGEAWRSLGLGADDVALLPLTDLERSRLGRRLDATGGLNETGSVLLIIPRDATMRALSVGGGLLEAFWIRCRADRRDRGQPFYDSSPVINGFLPESIGGLVLASHQLSVSNEELGRSDGSPGQVFSLFRSPVLPRHTEGRFVETLEVERVDGAFEAWQEVEHFGNSGPADPHFVLDSMTGEVQFGPMVPDATGQERQYGRVPPRGRLIRFTRYRTGGGADGNVGRGALTVPKSSTNLDYVKAVINLEPALGGRDGETLQEQVLRGPTLVRTRDVAVTRGDYEALVLTTFPQIARVQVRPVTGPSGAGGLQVTLVPVAPVTDQPLRPADTRITHRQRELAREVLAYLQQHSPLTTELAVTWAGYQWVSVSARLVVRLAPGLAPFEAEAARNAAREAAQQRLFRYIHPSAGGPDGSGWGFGQPLNAADVQTVLEETPGVRYASDVLLRAVSFDEKGRRTISPGETVLTPGADLVFCSDAHLLEVVAE